MQTWTRPRSSPAVRCSPVRGGRGILTDGLDPPFHASMRVEWRACSTHGSAGQPGTCGVPGEWSNLPAAGGSAPDRDEPRRRLPTGGRVQTWTRPRYSPAVRSSPVRGGRGISTEGLDPPSMRVYGWNGERVQRMSLPDSPPLQGALRMVKLTGRRGVRLVWSNSPAWAGPTHRIENEFRGEWSNSPAAAGLCLGAALR